MEKIKFYKQPTLDIPNKGEKVIVVYKITNTYMEGVIRSPAETHLFWNDEKKNTSSVERISQKLYQDVKGRQCRSEGATQII